MFSIFQKKTYLIDLLEGITDFHNHILPGIDDGAKTVNESVELINAFENIGITQLVATPHIIGEYYPNTPATIEAAIKEVKSRLPEAQVSAAAEYMMDQHFIEIIKEENILPVSGRNVLVEMSYLQPPINLNEILFKLQNNSYHPILAHPERYGYLQSRSLDKFENLKSRGCSLQVNMLSLSGHYGGTIQKIAFDLLEKDYLDFICSDVHKVEHIQKIQSIRIAKKYQNKIKKLRDNNNQLFKD